MADGSEAEYVAYVSGRIPALRRLAYLLCGNDHQADDLVQETITKIFVRWPQVRKAENIDNYVHTILVRTFLDDRRRGWWKVLLGTSPERAAPAGAAVEDREVLRAALAQVPPRQQAVLVLRFLDDRPVAEVAEIMGCSQGTVKSQTAHGLAALRRILGDQYAGTFTYGEAR
ncbi:SigE family RNA polymerase sigma factor [Winogradskya consettensis]|uniref:RNA polymerase sigma24 factor n=1 Tax=Winogradskya consettensis TaxID=113560 RepID=A0A919VMT9_9ACTN|nr:SigE family RNA polymerase sigma factor [Actinoplanes consettensis]GIM69195.1 RNA polymerase sigma24 factor [Actinoplanes consettensis]